MTEPTDERRDRKDAPVAPKPDPRATKPTQTEPAREKHGADDRVRTPDPRRATTPR